MRHWRVAEVFGPTIQGEGMNAGVPCYFIRFGGCDLRCSWCDTPHAVLPELVAQLPKMDAKEIMSALYRLRRGPEWVVITGGNPATLKLNELMHELKLIGMQVMVETQGTIYNDWLRAVDELCISPKPPSSGNPVTIERLGRFLKNFVSAEHAIGLPIALPRSTYLKVVVFNDADYEYAREVREAFGPFGGGGLPMFLSVGNDDPELPTVGNPYPDPEGHGGSSRGEVRDRVGHNLRVLAERVAHDRKMRNVRVMPQLHTIAWGNERGR